MTAVLEREPRCHFCGVEAGVVDPGIPQLTERHFIGGPFWTCPAHAAPFPNCTTPTECRGSCRAERACDE